VATRTLEYGKVPVLVKKRITFSLCSTDLIDNYVAVIPERTLLSPLCRRAAAAVAVAA
jgi:hypothetical protein